ncbi:MAG: cupin domain-containing protein [Chitinivibrionales bacterium]|nr:cupin domain-containing protein [Chitinivibrionales bacterium]
MPELITLPRVIDAAGNLPKSIEEYVGRISTNTKKVSIARMKSPAGWEEPGQTPEFEEYTLVLKGTLRVATKDTEYDVNAGQAIIIERNTWVKYSTPKKEGAEYISVCTPAFSVETVHRDA